MNLAMRSINDRSSRKVRKISDPELARFLRQIADLYRDEYTGNISLSFALSDLADMVSKRSQSVDSKHEAYDSHLDAHIMNADAAMIDRVIMDQRLTKADLVRVASKRFSIPKGRLQRLTVDGVRSELRSALLHEESLRIISQEAERSGSKRMS